jgi:hypothetical protein
MLFHIIAGDLSIAPRDDKGYLELNGKMGYYPIPLVKQLAINLDRVKVLDQLLSKLQQKHVPTTLVISPAYASYTEPDAEVVAVKKLVSKYDNVNFFNYENDRRFADPGLFDDGAHLNGAGAHKFSEDLATKLLAQPSTVPGSPK